VTTSNFEKGRLHDIHRQGFWSRKLESVVVSREKWIAHTPEEGSSLMYSDLIIDDRDLLDFLKSVFVTRKNSIFACDFDYVRALMKFCNCVVI
jgi:hypothetical protein